MKDNKINKIIALLDEKSKYRSDVHYIAAVISSKQGWCEKGDHWGEFAE
jgi:hypothetical protein